MLVLEQARLRTLLNLYDQVARSKVKPLPAHYTREISSVKFKTNFGLKSTFLRLWVKKETGVKKKTWGSKYKYFQVCWIHFSNPFSVSSSAFWPFLNKNWLPWQKKIRKWPCSSGYTTTTCVCCLILIIFAVHVLEFSCNELFINHIQFIRNWKTSVFAIINFIVKHQTNTQALHFNS